VVCPSGLVLVVSLLMTVVELSFGVVVITVVVELPFGLVMVVC